MNIWNASKIQFKLFFKKCRWFIQNRDIDQIELSYSLKAYPKSVQRFYPFFLYTYLHFFQKWSRFETTYKRSFSPDNPYRQKTRRQWTMKIKDGAKLRLFFRHAFSINELWYLRQYLHVYWACVTKTQNPFLFSSRLHGLLNIHASIFL